MNNKEYLEHLINNYITKNNSTVGLKEYLQQVNKVIRPINEEQEEISDSNGKGFQKVYKSSSYKTYNLYSNMEDATIFDKRGFANFLMLGLLSFFFEVLFVILSLCIY